MVHLSDREPRPARAAHRTWAYAPSAPCDARTSSWVCGLDYAARAGTVDVTSAYAGADPTSAQPLRSQPHVKVVYVDDTRHFMPADTRHFMPAAPEAHRG